MIVNPYKLPNDEMFKDEEKSKYNREIDIEYLQKYVINNYLEYLQKNLKQPLEDKIKELLIDKYNLTEEIKINKIISDLINKIFGYGILQKYIEMPYVTDIRVVRYDQVYIKEKGVWKKTNESFNSKEMLEEYIRFCVLRNNNNINFDVPMVVVSDKQYNLRIEAGIEPVNTVSPSLVIRIHRPNKNISLETLFIVDEMLDANSYKIILDAINNEKNIIISGKGGSGKTTLLRTIINKIPDTKAITINEETSELCIEGKNVIQREVLENRDNNKKITLEKLMKESLVMSSDVIVTGEIKNSEASVFIDAISTDHMGLATVHSDSVYNTVDRLVTLFKRDIRAQQYKEEFIKQILSKSIDYIIYIKNYKVMQIAKFNIKKNEAVLELIYNREENANEFIHNN